MVTQSSDVAILDRSAAQTSADFSRVSQSSSKSPERRSESEPVQFGEGRSPQKPSDIMSQRLQMLGSIVCLMQNSPLHRRYSIAQLEECFIPSLLHNQFRYYEIDGVPVGFVNWAWLNDETEKKYVTGKYELALDEWVGGDSLWFPEFVAPYGHARKMVADLRTNVHEKGTPAKALRVSPDGGLMGIAKYRL